MKNVAQLSKTELLAYKESLEKTYEDYRCRGLSLDMSRGKPSPSQLNLCNELLKKPDSFTTEAGFDVRNYGILDGLPECKSLFSELLDIAPENMIIGGNSSINLMYDQLTRLCLFGTHGEKPWKAYELEGTPIKFLCPSPGYDMHFRACKALGIQMITIPLKEDGPDMDMVEELAGKDPLIKGIWCVPLYSNPEGICYSDEIVERLASMRTAANDFRIFWDNAYGIHHIYEKVKLKNILKACESCGNEDRVYYLFSTSKITFPGAGVSLIASGMGNINEIKSQLCAQTIGYDKINQLRHVQYFKNAAGILKHMDVLADLLRPKFDIVLSKFDENLSGTGLARWTNPLGGYFISLYTLPGCAKETIRLTKEAGVTLTPAGSTYPYGKDETDSNIRIAPTYPAPDELSLAMDILCIAIKLTGVRSILSKMDK